MADSQQNSQQNQNIQVKIEPATENGIFSNAVSVHVNQNEVVVDFGYILPNMKPTTIKVVSRVNMTHQTAESFMKVISNAMLDWRNRQKQSK
ncbi:MAG TPA: DUF3467 domain-containing protein [Candidatus Gracilibacteria bacterium]|nr:DUF3467 domain-containing protein [Candidatus Gracilibacteria bacterium]